MMSFLLMYLILLFIALGCFLCFHIFLVVTNRTTNEICKSRKTNSVIDDVKDDTANTIVGGRSTKVIKSKSRILNHKLRNKSVDVRSSSKHLKRTQGFMFGAYSRGVLKNIWEVVTG